MAEGKLDRSVSHGLSLSSIDMSEQQQETK
jgi:hypothetical protein